MIALVASSGASCAFFYRQPALPRRAVIESRGTPRADEEFAALVQSADIIYFPTELLGTPSQSAPGSKLLNALKENGSPFVIGWDLIGGEDQAALDQWTKRTLTTEDLISRLHFSGTARERESCRALLRQTREGIVRFLGLRCPPGGWVAPASSAAAEALAPGERSGSFRLPPGDFERIAERLVTRDPDENALRTAYAKALRAEEFAAERIIGNFREHRDEKLLVLAHRLHFQSGRGVPYFVAQRIKARQLVLDAQPRPARSRLLTGSDRSGVFRGFEIID